MSHPLALAAVLSAAMLAEPLPDFEFPTRSNVARPQASQAAERALRELEAAAGSPLVVSRDAASGLPRLVFARAGALTGPDPRDPEAIARDFVRSHAALFGLEPAAAEGFAVTRRFGAALGELTVLHLGQVVDGVPVHLGDLRFAVTRDGSIASLAAGRLAAGSERFAAARVLTPEQALTHAARAVGVELETAPPRQTGAAERLMRFDRGPFQDSPSLEAVFWPQAGTARPAFAVTLQPQSAASLYEVLIDAADGRLLRRHDLTERLETRGLVFQQNPLEGPPALTLFHDSSFHFDERWPLGWADSDETIGNVVDAKEDHAGDNETTIGLRGRDSAPGAPILFEAPWLDAYELDDDYAADTPFVVTQLFYFANVHHDWMYGLGFDEAAGNWQADNFGRGGLGGDRLFADAQDSVVGHYNNAAITTPRDGQSPRVWFYLFREPLARRHAELDGDVVFHELSHGVVNRLLTSGSCLRDEQGDGLGEGWASFYPIAYFEDPVLGEYIGLGEPDYDSYPACHLYDGLNFCPSPALCPAVSGYCTGGLWTAVLWEMRRALVAADPGGGAEVALRLVTDGLKLTPCEPTFLDARDAILLADRYAYAGAHQCLIWEVLAARAMGWSASTTGPDDSLPIGGYDLPPECTGTGRVLLDRDSYSCDDRLIATVHDGDAAADISLTLSALISGDREVIDISGAPPTFVSPPVPVVLGARADDDGVLQVALGDTIRAEYLDGGLVTASAPVECLLDATIELELSGGCDPDSAAWPGGIDPILDAGETLEARLRIENTLARALEDIEVTLVAVSTPDVAALDPGPIGIPLVAPYTGTGVARFELAAASSAAPGEARLDFLVTARGFTGTRAPVSFTIPLHGDYAIVEATTGVEDFEASDGGYTHRPWDGFAVDEWSHSTCAAASGIRSWYVGPVSCSGFAAEQDALLISPAISPLGVTRRAWYPTELRFNHELELARFDEAAVWLAAADLPAEEGMWATVTFFDEGTGGAFEPVSRSFAPEDTLDASPIGPAGLRLVFDISTAGDPGLSERWAVDDVELVYSAADVVPQPPGPRCPAPGFTGSLAGCPAPSTIFAWNADGGDTIQYAGDGAFWLAGTGWELRSEELAPPPAPGDTVVVVASHNPDDALHEGVVAINARRLADGLTEDFGEAACVLLPTAVGPAEPVSEGAAIALAWEALDESGSERATLGYDVYRIDAELFSSRIDDYLASGVLVGTTEGQPDINHFVDTAPPVASGSLDEWRYAISPRLRCDGPACAGSIALTFGGSEGVPGKPNLSADNHVTDGLTRVPGTIKVATCATLSPFNLEPASLKLVKGGGCAPLELGASWETAAAGGAETYNVHELVTRARFVAERAARPYPLAFAGPPLACCGAIPAPDACVSSSPLDREVAYYSVWQADDCTLGSLADRP